jgi:hypothetical protein
MEAVVAAETAYSVTYENDGGGNTGGIWKTLSGVYDYAPPSPAFVSVNANGPYATEYPSTSQAFTFTRTVNTGNQTVYFTISGTGVAGVHYQEFSDQVSFADGQTSVTATVTPLTHGAGEAVSVIVTLDSDPEDPDTYTPSGGSATIIIVPRAGQGGTFRPPPGQRAVRVFP